jgi:hypothetical protein
LKNLDDNVDINRTWESIREIIKTLTKESLDYYKPKQHKSRFDKEPKGSRITAMVAESKPN